MRLHVKNLQKLAYAMDCNLNYVPTPLSLKTLMDFGQDKTGESEIRSFNFLRDEIPVRLSHIMQEFTKLPKDFSSRKSVQLVKSWYDKSYEELMSYQDLDKTNPVIRKRFTENIENILKRHSHVVEYMAQGVMEMQETFNTDPNSSEELQYFLDRFYMNRISIRSLLGQHVNLFKPKKEEEMSRLIGIIDPECDIKLVIMRAYNKAKSLCEMEKLVAPNMELTECNTWDEGKPIKIVCVPDHLEYMVRELLKNSMRAVVEHTESLSKEKEMPDIRVIISKGKEDLTIKVSDNGGGVPYSKTDLLFRYHYSTAPRPQEVGPSEPLAGFGYGLPLSRLFARYLNGEISLSSVEGYGTDAYIYLKVDPKDAGECLPVYNTTTSRMYNTSQVIPDWSSPRPWNQSYRMFSTGVCHIQTNQKNANAFKKISENTSVSERTSNIRGETSI